MNDQTDQQLLTDYAERRSEPAFNELVRRHIDLVHSAAFRLTGEAHSAQDVTQTVFVALAQSAARLSNHPVLSGWLHTTTRHLAAKNIRAAARRQNHEQEAVAMNELLCNAPDTSWQEIAPHLDVALGELNEFDRDAILLRYFEKKSAQEMAEVLGITAEAAQKRVSRSVERLREFFAKRGVTVGTSGLVVVLSANAVQAAPVGLALTIASATALTGTTLATIATVTAAKAIAMTTLQKTLIAITLVAAVGTGVYEVSQNAKLRDQVRAFAQQQAEQAQEFQRERDETAAKLTALRDEHESSKSNSTELLKLRAEVSRLRAGQQPTTKPRAAAPRTANAPATTNTPPTESELPKDSWADIGFATPQSALQTRGWAVLNGNRERFKESVVITDGARKLMEGMLEKMIAAAPAADRKQFSQMILDNKLGLEEGLLMPMMAENQAKGYTGYQILSQQSPSADEMILQVATGMASAPTKKETLKFRRVGTDWRVVIDEDFIKSQH